MMAMRIIFATLFFAMLGIGSVLSQNTGFGGKRFLIKTTALDGIEGFLTDGGVEIVMGDAWTLTGGLNWQSHERQTDYQAEIRGWGNGCIFDKKVNKSLYVKYRSVYVAGRIYGSAGSKKDFVGAPQGWFGSAGVEGGIMKLDGYYHRGVEHNEAAGLDGSGEPDYVGPCTQDAAEVKYNSNFPFMTFRFGGGSEAVVARTIKRSTEGLNVVTSTVTW